MIDQLFPVIPSIVVALVVLGGLLFFELRRKQKYLVLRIIAQVLLVASVLLLTLRPSVTTTKQDQSILLLTDGYDQKVVDSLQSLRPVLVKSPNELSNLNGVSVIAGHGLPSWALDLLPNKNFSFLPGPAPKGITSIGFDDHIYAHRWNEIRGTYNGEPALLKLRGPGGIDDSVNVANGPFSLTFFAKAPGRFNYELITTDTKETLPLVIEPERTFNIIFISEYPTFEVRYLKNFLASKGHRLSIRNQVSRGRYKFEFANRPPSAEAGYAKATPAGNFQSLTPALLDETDLLVIDERSLNALNAGEQRTVQASINNGLGVILLPEAETTKQKFHLIQFTSTQQKDTTRVSLGRAGPLRLPVMSIEAKQSNALLTAPDGRVVNGYVHSGAGKIGYQLLNETYQPGLQGKAEAYSALWVPLLERCARTQKNDFKVKITSPFPHYENQPITFDIISSGKEPKLAIDNIDFPLTEDVYIDDLWHGTTWLEGNSWHDLVIDSATTSIHVSKAGDWATVRANNNRKATALQAGQSNNDNNSIAVKDDRRLKIILFSIFILAAGFLWLAPKL
jgi:hypothetical protein